MHFDSVIEKQDLSLRQMRVEIDRFAASLEPGDLALFYYAGHGVQANQQNYLIPIDFASASEADLPYDAYPAQQVRDKLEDSGARLRIIILDACRNNPFRAKRGGRRGLAPMDSPAEVTYIAFATGDNDVADDHPAGGNGLFTEHLLAALRTPGLDLKQIFERTKEEVFPSQSGIPMSGVPINLTEFGTADTIAERAVDAVFPAGVTSVTVPFTLSVLQLTGTYGTAPTSCKLLITLQPDTPSTGTVTFNTANTTFGVTFTVNYTGTFTPIAPNKSAGCPGPTNGSKTLTLSPVPFSTTSSSGTFVVTGAYPDPLVSQHTGLPAGFVDFFPPQQVLTHLTTTAVHKILPAPCAQWSNPKFDVLYTFGGEFDGKSPVNTVLLSGCNLYGAASEDGTSEAGTLFRYNLTTNQETTLHAFAAGATDGGQPLAGLIQDSAGNLYGTTETGGSTNHGTVFLSTTSGKVTILHSFASTPDGAYPEGGLLLQGKLLFGTTTNGGAGNFGTVFVLTPPTVAGGAWTEKILFSFAGPNGQFPYGALVADKSGNLYGTTNQGGNAMSGTVFKLTPAGTLTTLYSFSGGADGGDPLGGLVYSTSSLYGTTSAGGSGFGTVFQLPQEGSSLTVLHSFTDGADGGIPSYGNLAIDSQGDLFGATSIGGILGSSVIGVGTLFVIPAPPTVLIKKPTAAR